MQAVILAAGKSKRFYPYTFSHKSLITLLGKPIIARTIESIREAGIKDIILVVSKNSEIQKVIASGKEFGVNIKYVIQENPTGAGNGLLLTESFIRGDFFLLNVSRVDFSSFKKLITEKKDKNTKAVLLGKKQNNLSKYGVLKVKGDKVLDLIEKPLSGKEPSNIRLVGVYLFSKYFFEVLKKTKDEHYRLEKAISNLSKNHTVKYVLIENNVPSLKYPWDLLDLKNYLLSNIRQSKISKKAKIAKSCEILGNVLIEENAQIMEGVRIKGPCFIGKGSIVGNNSILRNGVDIGENCVVGAGIEIKNSLIMKNSKTHSGFIGDTIIGESVRIGAHFVTANKRIDRKNIWVKNEEEEGIDTGHKSLGAIIGSGVKIGIKSSTMPGVIIGENSVIGPSTTVLKNVASNSRYYTKFQEVVVKK